MRCVTKTCEHNITVTAVPSILLSCRKSTCQLFMVCLHKMKNDRPLSPLEIGLKTEHTVVCNTIIDHQKLCETMLDSIYEQSLQEKNRQAEQY